MNYKTIHTAIKNKFIADGYKYAPASEWIDPETGELPQSFVNNSFTIRLEAKERGPSLGHIKVRAEIEFALDTKHDNYLDKLTTIQTSVLGLRGTLSSSARIENYQEWDLWQSGYFNKVVLITFPNIEIIITLT